MPADPGLRQNASEAAAPDLTGDLVLPITFWDAPPPSVDLDEDEPPASLPPLGYDAAYDSIHVEDLGAHWIARATDTPELDSFEDADELDDPAEIAADSMSMVSEASRAAASLDLAEAAEAFDDDGEDSRL